MNKATISYNLCAVFASVVMITGCAGFLKNAGIFAVTSLEGTFTANKFDYCNTCSQAQQYRNNRYLVSRAQRSDSLIDGALNLGVILVGFKLLPERKKKAPSPGTTT